jgi:hypothetical protein
MAERVIYYTTINKRMEAGCIWKKERHGECGDWDWGEANNFYQHKNNCYYPSS